MRKTILIILCSSFALITGAWNLRQSLEPKIKVEHSLQEWQSIYGKLNLVVQYLDKTNLPHQEVRQLQDSLISVEQDLSVQIVPQIPKDTIIHKK